MTTDAEAKELKLRRNIDDLRRKLLVLEYELLEVEQKKIMETPSDSRQLLQG